MESFVLSTFICNFVCEKENVCVTICKRCLTPFENLQKVSDTNLKRGCRYYTMPKGKDPLFWKHKIELNQARDYRVRVDLELLGWNVITIWECELKKDKRDETLARVRDWIVEQIIFSTKNNLA